MTDPLIITCHQWGTKYGPEYVERLRTGIKKHLKQPHWFIVVRPPDEDAPLFPGCLVRLKMFGKDFQRGFAPGARIVSMDLDMVITGPLDPLFDRPETFVIWQGANASNPNPYNGSIFMLRAGHHHDLWDDFSLEKAAKMPAHEFPDDQGWMHWRRPNAAGWNAGSASGIYGYKKPGWPGGKTSEALPKNARIVSFFGKRDVSDFVNVPWIRQHWIG